MDFRQRIIEMRNTLVKESLNKDVQSLKQKNILKRRCSGSKKLTLLRREYLEILEPHPTISSLLQI